MIRHPGQGRKDFRRTPTTAGQQQQESELSQQLNSTSTSACSSSSLSSAGNFNLGYQWSLKMVSHHDRIGTSIIETDNHDYGKMRYDTNATITSLYWRQTQSHSLGLDSDTDSSKSSQLLSGSFQSTGAFLLKLPPANWRLAPIAKLLELKQQVDQLQLLRPLILLVMLSLLPEQLEQQPKQPSRLLSQCSQFGCHSRPAHYCTTRPRQHLLFSLMVVTLAIQLAFVGHGQARGFDLTFDDVASDLPPTIGGAGGKSMLRLQIGPLNCDREAGQSVDGITGEVINMLSIFKCKLKPLLEIIRRMLPYRHGGTLAGGEIGSLNALDVESGKQPRRPEQQSVWDDYQNLINLIDNFELNVMPALNMRDLCTTQTVEKFTRLKGLTISKSKLLTYLYNIITIDYHKLCLAEAISKLPQVPYLIREVVDIYLSGADQAVLDLNGKPPQVFDELGANHSDDFQFNLQEALERNGQLSDIVKLSISMPTTDSNQVQTFKEKCREFLLDIEASWQTMEMMSKTLSTDGNGIQSFNNYVMRRLTPTKFADVCSQLSSAAPAR